MIYQTKKDMKGFTPRFKIFKEGVTTKGFVTIASKDGKPFNEAAKRDFYTQLGYKVKDL